MNSTPKHIAHILLLRLTGELTEAQSTELENWLHQSSKNRAIVEELATAAGTQALLERQQTDKKEAVQQQLLTRIRKMIAADKDEQQQEISAAPVLTHRIHFLRRWSWAAAMLVLLSGLGVYFFNNQSYKSQKSSQITVQTKGPGTEIPPGTDKAVWTLANGRQIELDSTLLDMTAKKEHTENIGYNELRTPRGGQYQLILPDGSKAWLNAASSIKYPVAFSSKERKIEVAGEVYLEVAKNIHQPFIVTTTATTTQVLGTSFNINAYPDDIVKITLAEGSIKVNNLLLNPGQAYTKNNIITTNIEEDLAWKNNIFHFNNTEASVVLKQLSRWYDIVIVYPEGMPTAKVTGEMGRNLNLSDVLHILNGVGLKTELKGRELWVSSK